MSEGYYKFEDTPRVRRSISDALYNNQHYSKQDPDESITPNTLPSVGAVLRRIYARIENLEASMNSFERPMGTQQNPARHCRDIFEAAEFPETFKSGIYWIDPNLGSPTDAFTVECRFQNKGNVAETCIKPSEDTKTQPLTNFVKTNNSEDWWISHLKQQKQNGTIHKTQLYYAPTNQIRYLQLLHSKAEQVITFTCRNTPVYFDVKNQNYRNAVVVKLFDENVIDTYEDRRTRAIGGSILLDIKVKDECMERSKQKASSVFEFVARKPNLLPLVDIQLKEFGESDQEIGYYMDAVCFS
uniref:SJCHGC05265 protein n=3 Tax=Schistosoma japonicum TaxID=6182 RepID=Q5DGV3_SCHJA|nr:SJCHGC05265 protein [Schistosoma japonicum]